MRDRLMRYTRWAAVVLFWPAVAVVVWGELSTQAQGALHIWDKALHFTAYFGLAGLACVAVGGGKRALWTALGLVVLGAILEVLQGMVGRDMSLYDEFANGLGVLVGTLLAHYGLMLLASGRLVGAQGPD